ncbi:Tetratricopeptide repeat-containing protein [Terriglobus roseus]|uniref:Tetratricopeptide repeat-containing protein n=1 Tax=Terriglobus roseus TaxID=392734 RepID=A0A1H4ISE8_9BACT|nr:Tetratricopeptide repeat-containing protein [Terriglobus roseus]
MIGACRATCISLLLAATSAAAQIPASALADARAGRVDASVAALKPIKNADAQELLCKLYSSVDARDAAISACESAVSLAPSNSDYALELARVYGNKADHSGTFTGMRMVSKIRTNFEKAVQLNPKSVEALSDLGQFYAEAPGIVGGGADKARDLVTRLQPLSPARSHRLAAMIAAKAKDDTTAEAEYRAELAAGHTPEAYVDLAGFYRSRKQNDRAVENARLALAADTHRGPDTLDAAKILIDLQHPADAVNGLRAYLNTQQAGVSAFAQAHVLLGNALRATGDTAGAQKEFAAALALAPNYDAARKGAGQ